MPIINPYHPEKGDLGADTHDSAPYDSYMNDVTGSLKDGYNNLASANPYASNTYQQSFWDKIGNWLGFNTTEDRLRLEQEQNSKEWMSQLAMMQHEEEYNDPSQQAARMRAAGLNPDLQGVDNAGTAGTAPGDETSPSFEAVGHSFQSFIGDVFSAVSGAMSVCSGIYGIKDRIADLALKKEGLVAAETDNILKETGVVDYLSRSINRGEFDSRVMMHPNGNFTRIIKSSTPGELDAVENLGSIAMSPELGRRLSPMFNTYYGSLKNIGNLASGESYTLDSLQGRAKRQASSLYGSVDDDAEFWSKLVEPISKFQDKLERESLRSKSSAAEYEAEFTEGLDPALAAKAENDESEARSTVAGQTNQGAKMQKELQGTMAEIVDVLSKDSKDKKSKTRTLSSISLMLLYIGQNSSASFKSGPKGKSFGLGM